MQTATFEGIELDRCDICRGIFFDRGELDQMIQRKVPGADALAYAALSETMDELAAICPRCEREMAPRIGAAQIKMDVCDKCDSVFLDQGELAALQHFSG
jgi:Zn-finger nucleic acid-binding protein